MATLRVEDTFLDSEETEGSLFKRLDGRDRGWRVELLVEQLTNKMEGKFLLCNYCTGLMRDACLVEKEGKQELRCYACIPDDVTWRPVQMNRETINEKPIRCPFMDKGCDWRNTVNVAVQHMEECEFLPVMCPLKCVQLEGERSGKVLLVERRLMEEHEREYCPQREQECKFCGSVLRACEMLSHLKECEEFPVDCPNGCEISGETGTRQVKRGDVHLHLTEECPLQTVKCPYWEYGCGEEMERRQVDLHENESMHIHLKLSVKEMKQKQIESNKKIEERDAQILQSTNRILSLERLNADKDFEISSVKHEVTELKETISTLVTTGKLEWKIYGVKQKILNKDVTYSDPFNVGLYKCQVKIVWDNLNTRKVGCFLCVRKGEFDDKLVWPFIYRFKFVLLCPSRSKYDYVRYYEISKNDLQRFPECFQKPTGERNKCIGAFKFISNTEFFTDQYCKGSHITLHIIVQQLPTF